MDVLYHIAATRSCGKSDRLLELLASGASREDVLRAYPQLTAESLAAALAYAARALKNEVVWSVKVPA